jgi:DDE superfamily endonuclease
MRALGETGMQELLHKNAKHFMEFLFIFMNEIVTSRCSDRSPLLPPMAAGHRYREPLYAASSAAQRPGYLPPYSPDLNPIEQAFAKIKHWMRIAQKRTIEDTSRHLGDLVTAIQTRERNNYFANAGYASVKM